MSVVETKVENKVGKIILRNDPLNILEMEHLQLIEDAVHEMDNNDEVSVIYFTMVMQKEGKIFSAGMDLDEMLATQEEENGIENYCKVSKRNYSCFYYAKKPVIYVYDGIVRGGGCEMSLFADYRIAGEKLNIALPEIGIGIIPGGGGTQTLQRLIGVANAKSLIYTGRPLKAEEAKEVGLVQNVFPSDSLQEEATKIAEKMAKNSPQGLQAAKRAINDGAHLPIDKALAFETEVFIDNFKTEDAAEGIKAFKEKREPNYKNR
ncbi:crotonase [Aerococcus urinae]|uniref:enoyl-CoA hydratase/isomerase family protein n=1 Tax=Aerococcus urinae TaxID=1376 RepID=UPI000DCB516C|nr:enoyl-CoA hydratase/isomerase family protein [Aerococcus urinae]RAV67165.1 crotonase [Aerococcus urinae]